MEAKLSNHSTYKHISKATDEIVNYIQDRKDNKIKSLRTRWHKFNRLCMGGIEPNAIYTFTGISGSGKSSMVNTLETDLVDLNPKENIVVLSFNYEMLSSKQVGRKLSYKLRQTTSDLYSATTSINETLMDEIKKAAEKFKYYPVYYVDEPQNLVDMENTISYFLNTIAKDKWLVVILDHALLIKSSGDSERQTISDIQKLFMRMKKIGRTSILQISQMNRNIEAPERINNQALHYPMRSDISTSDSIFQASDYVFVIHRPEILGLNEYGIYGLPTKDFVYLHCLKNRDGEVKTLKFVNDLKYNNLKEPEQEEESNPQQQISFTTENNEQNEK